MRTFLLQARFQPQARCFGWAHCPGSWSPTGRGCLDVRLGKFLRHFEPQGSPASHGAQKQCVPSGSRPFSCRVVPSWVTLLPPPRWAFGMLLSSQMKIGRVVGAASPLLRALLRVRVTQVGG